MERRPDLLVVKGATLYIMELTVGFEVNIEKNAARKEAKYEELCHRLNNQYDEVNFVNLSMASIRVFGKSCNSLFNHDVKHWYSRKELNFYDKNGS